MRRRKNVLTNLRPAPGCPTLAWLIAKRVTDPIIELDCTIMITGKKGSGKSIFSVGLGYEISKAVSAIKHKKELRALTGEARRKRHIELADHYFNMDHITSVDKDGTMQMFSGDVIMTENAILLADDVSIAANSRNSMTQNNKALSQIMTVSRPYRNVVILNTVYSTLVDKTARNFSDIVIELIGIDKKLKRSIARVFLYSVNQSTGKEYRKYFRWDNKRIKYWSSDLPPKRLRDAYKKLRLDKTKELIDGFRAEQDARSEKGTKREKKSGAIITEYSDIVLKMYKDGASIKAITRVAPELTEYWVNKIISTKGGNE